MSPSRSTWTATISIQGGEGFGTLNESTSAVLAEIADLGGRLLTQVPATWGTSQPKA